MWGEGGGGLQIPGCEHRIKCILPYEKLENKVTPHNKNIPDAVVCGFRYMAEIFSKISILLMA